ncbi:MAG TPA: recombinase family protein, partial [Candidatus Saccharimonadales bacterium]|nr:recombinase family protein [Candidatus Saccharimonadales bacterium]
MKQPVAYLRKSSVTSDRHVSWDVQEDEVRSVAARHGDGDPMVLSDWNKSGRGSRTRFRTEYARLRAMITGGEVSALYSYSLSRLARSTKELLDLAESCAAAHVPIRLAKEGDLDFGTPHGRLYLTVLAAVATFEADVAGERVSDAIRARRARGDYLGLAPYGERIVDGRLAPDPAEPLQPIIAAFEAAGSCYGAARRLNVAGSRTRRGSLWTSKVVGNILRRAGITYAHRPHPGAKERADWILFRLLVCPCGNVMTAMDKRSARYTCYRSRHDPGHSQPFSISEAKLLPAIKAEAARLRPVPQVVIEDQEPSRREAIRLRRERVIDSYVSGLIDKA